MMRTTRLEFKSYLKDKKLLYFDTEQSEYHAGRVANRISKLSGGKIPEGRFNYFGLRPIVDDCLRVIKDIIYNTDNLGVVIIDGIADLVNGYNDEEQAAMITKELLKWSAENNCHIITVIHENKGDSNAKGHLGSFILQKAETVLKITKSKDGEVSTVEATHSRGMDIPNISFTVDESGLPVIVEYQPTEKKKVKKLLPNDYELESNKNLVREIFSEEEEINRTKMLELIRYQVSRCYSVDIGENKCRLWLTYFKEEDMVTQPQKNGSYRLNC